MTRPFDRSTLDSQLDSYTGTVTSYQASRSWKDRLGAWSAYAAVSGSALALATSANASIIYSGIQNISVSVPELPGDNSDFKRLPNFPFLIRVRNVLNTSIRRAAALLYGNSIFTTGNSNALNLAASQQLTGPRFDRYGAGLRHLYVIYPSFVFTDEGEFRTGVSGFAGLSFYGGAFYRQFGWIRLRVDDTNTDGFIDKLTAIDWAYETVPGAPLHVGATSGGVIPEPSTAALALLAFGSAGVLAWRKRRKPATQ
jgi:hypothetical protein